MAVEKGREIIKSPVVKPEPELSSRPKVTPLTDWRDQWVYYRGTYIRKSQIKWCP
jgi:3'-phosphoadenosine 5'-phosphosulfate sulfotransferase (PAPS reductase)/FAD synthetase